MRKLDDQTLKEIADYVTVGSSCKIEWTGAGPYCIYKDKEAYSGTGILTAIFEEFVLMQGYVFLKLKIQETEGVFTHLPKKNPYTLLPMNGYGRDWKFLLN